MRISKKLAALGAFFVLALAVAGCGSSIPGNSVASVDGNPITLAAFQHWMYLAAKSEAAQQETSTVIVPSDPPEFTSCIKQIRAGIPSLAKSPAKTLRSDCSSYYNELKSEVMTYLIESYWYQAQAHRDGISPTSAQIQAAIKKEYPKLTTKELTTELKAGGETMADFVFQFRANYVYQKLLKRVTKPITSATISEYYRTHLSTFGTKAYADLHLISTSSQSQAEAAYSALKSGTSWTTVAKKYASSASEKQNGGLLTDVTQGEEEQVVNQAIFSSPLNRVAAPLHGSLGWYVIEVTKRVAATQKSLAQATSEIKQLLKSSNGQDADAAVNKAAKKAWGKQTLCRALYSVPDCANYVAPKTTTSTTPAATSTTSTTTGTSTATTSSTASSSSTSTTKSSSKKK